MADKLTSVAKVTTIDKAAPGEKLLMQVSDRMCKVVSRTYDDDSGKYIVTLESDGETFNVMVPDTWLVVRVPQFIYNQWVG